MSVQADATSSSSVGIKKGEAATVQALLQDNEIMKDPFRREKLFSRYAIILYFKETNLVTLYFISFQCSILCCARNRYV